MRRIDLEVGAPRSGLFFFFLRMALLPHGAAGATASAGGLSFLFVFDQSDHDRAEDHKQQRADGDRPDVRGDPIKHHGSPFIILI